MANHRLLLRLLIALVCLVVLFSFTFCLSDDDDYDEVTTVVTPIDSKPVAVAPSLSVVVTSELNLDDDEDEDEDMDKELTTSKITSTVNSIRSQKPKDFDDDDDYEEDDDGDDDSSSCSAQFFLEKLIPEDYPTAISKDVSHINETIQRLNKMHAYSTQLRDNWTPFIRELGSHLSDSLYEAQLETNCMVSLYKIISAVQNDQKAWALSFLDATGKVMESGYQEGRFVSLGEFDQCLAIQSELPDEMVAGEPIRGQYCLLKPIIPLPEKINRQHGLVNSSIEQVNKLLNDEYIVTYLELYQFLKNTILRFGVCLPDKCDPMDVENALNKFLVRKTGLSVKIGPQCSKATDSWTLDTPQIIVLAIFCILLFLVLVCSLFELVYRLLLDSGHAPSFFPQSSYISTPFSFTSSKAQSGKLALRQLSTVSTAYTAQPLHIQLCTLFSVIRNTRVLFAIPTYRKIPLDTIRLLLILYYFIANSYIFTVLFAPMVLKRFYVLGPLQLASERKYFFIRLYYIIDVFLALSGISISLAYTPKTFNYAKYLLQNYLRVLLPVLFSIGLIIVLPLAGSGPLWHLFDQTMTVSCRHNIWPSLLMHSNLDQNFEDVCNLSTSFVSLIFQAQLLAPLFLSIAYCLTPKRGTFFLVVVFCLMTLLQAIPRYLLGYKIPYEFKDMKSFGEIKHSIMFYGLHPVMHASSLVFGLIVGHLMCRPVLGPMGPRFSRTVALGGFLFLGFLGAAYYVEQIDMFNPNLTEIEILGMVTFARVSFLGFFCWIVYAAVTGRITLLRRFLSSIIWRPLSQLSFGFYLVSMSVIMCRLFSIRETTTIAPDNMARAIVSDAVLAFVFAYLMHILVQQPMRNARQVLVHWRQLAGDSDSTLADERHQPEMTSYADNGNEEPNKKVANTEVTLDGENAEQVTVRIVSEK